MSYETTYDIVQPYHNPSVFLNSVYDSVLGNWQQWTNKGILPDVTGVNYNSSTGGDVGNWKADSYSWKLLY